MKLESLTLNHYILLGTLIFFLIQLLYYSILYIQLLYQRKKERKGKINYEESYPPLSIVISADDVTEKLEQQLPLLLKQDYPNYEVIVINDSTRAEEKEATNDLLERLATQHTNLHYSFTPESARYISRKKLSLTLGIKASKYDWIVFTEPGFCPTSNQWLKKMARNFTPETSIVFGYAGYNEVKGWKNRKLIYASALDAIRYLGLALTKSPYKAYGKNLAYRKELFYENKGYSSHLNLLRGEDDLFINKTATAKNTRVEVSPESILKYMPNNSNRYWKNETQNYLLSSYFYKGRQRYLLGFETFSKFLFIAGVIAGIVMSLLSFSYLWGAIFLALYLFRYLFQGIILNKNFQLLGYKKLFVLSLPLLDVWLPLYNLRLKMQLLFKGKRDYMRKE